MSIEKQQKYQPYLDYTAQYAGSLNAATGSTFDPNANVQQKNITTLEGEMFKKDFIGIFKANVPNVLQEKGCIEYVPTIDVPTDLPPQEKHRNAVTIVEKWETLDDLMAHMKAPHMLTYGEKVKDMVEKKSLKILTPA